MSDNNARRIACQVEGETLVVTLGNDRLYLTRDEACRLWWQSGEVVMNTFDLDENGNIVDRNMEADEIEVGGVSLSIHEGKQLFIALETCVNEFDGAHADEWEPDSNECVWADVRRDRVNWKEEGF